MKNLDHHLKVDETFPQYVARKKYYADHHQNKKSPTEMPNGGGRSPGGLGGDGRLAWWRSWPAS
jgi:hypothetical protein